MYNIRTETPSGSQSRGYEYETEEKAIEVFAQVKAQLDAMGFVGDLVMTEAGVEYQREAIPNAA